MAQQEFCPTGENFSAHTTSRKCVYRETVHSILSLPLPRCRAQFLKNQYVVLWKIRISICCAKNLEKSVRDEYTVFRQIKKQWNARQTRRWGCMVAQARKEYWHNDRAAHCRSKRSRDTDRDYREYDAARRHSPESIYGPLFAQGRRRRCAGTLSRAALGARGAWNCRGGEDTGGASRVGEEILRDPGRFSICAGWKNSRGSRFGARGDIL